jgi:hypothetical protein
MIGVGVVAAIAVLPGVSGATARRHKSIHFTTVVVGAAISSTQSVFSAHDSIMGNGAGTQTLTFRGSGGSDSEITYYGTATARSKGTFTFGVPDASGIAAVNGTGHDFAGTGKFKHLKSDYTYAGTYDTRTGLYRVTLRGTESF